MSNILLVISGLKLDFHLKGEIVNLNPDDRYRRYTQYPSLLPFNTMSWLFSLVILFLHVFPIELHDTLYTDSYKLPNFSLFTTK